jgi:hypothetical protein
LIWEKNHCKLIFNSNIMTDEPTTPVDPTATPAEETTEEAPMVMEPTTPEAPAEETPAAPVEETPAE